MFSYKITMIDPALKRFDIYFSCLQDGKEIAKDCVQIDAGTMQNIVSDGREEYINQVVADACKKYMVIKDVENDFSDMVGVEVQLESMKYETKEVREVRLEAEQAQREALMEATGTKNGSGTVIL